MIGDRWGFTDNSGSKVWTVVQGREVRVPWSLISPASYPLVLPLSQRAHECLEQRSRMRGTEGARRHTSPPSPNPGILQPLGPHLASGSVHNGASLPLG